MTTADALLVEVGRRADALNPAVLLAAMGEYRHRCTFQKVTARVCSCGGETFWWRREGGKWCGRCRKLMFLSRCRHCHWCLTETR